MTSFLPEGKRIDTAENLTALSSFENMHAAMERGDILEARAVLCDHDHNLKVDLPCMRGVIPREEGALGIREGSVRDIAVISRVGRAVCFVIKEFIRQENGVTAVLSRADAQQKCADRYLSRLHIGDVIPARITHLEPFGAFCDIGCGLVALMPIDAISVSRIEHPDERFTVGMDIYAVVKSITDHRVTLSHKELLGTWTENAARFAVGETVMGVIRSIENYGAFVELMPNLAGLAELRDNLRVGDTAAVYIKSIIPQKMKIKLIIIDNFGEPHVPTVPEYFITHGHMERFTYSPPECNRLIETEFI
ncbi:S1 RNA-binding domain-containing protein [Ruminococcus sp.]|uniref:S1 RNA-binding domain-containing protein n=1 Tax=Ruminococcus sp. TaxID=41978 RepID=UPI003865ED0C